MAEAPRSLGETHFPGKMKPLAQLLADTPRSVFWALKIDAWSGAQGRWWGRAPEGNLVIYSASRFKRFLRFNWCRV